MAMEAAHAHPHAEAHVPRIAWGVLAVSATVIASAWALTWWTADDFGALLMAQLAGASPASTLIFLALSGTMMVAMMLPSALPMLDVYRGLSRADARAVEARVRTTVFTLGYFVVWTAFTALSLVALAGFGAMGSMSGPFVYAPGLLLLGAGVYQFTGWKAFCLRHCRTPVSFVMTHWRGGRAGALRMGLDHGAYCLGCCWLLMLVLFVAGAMSVLWMGVFALFILGEKVWSRGERFSRAMGIGAILAGLAALALADPSSVAPSMPMA